MVLKDFNENYNTVITEKSFWPHLGVWDWVAGSWSDEQWLTLDKKTFVFRAVLLSVIELLNGWKEELLILTSRQNRSCVYMCKWDVYLLISLCTHISCQYKSVMNFQMSVCFGFSLRICSPFLISP